LALPFEIQLKLKSSSGAIIHNFKKINARSIYHFLLWVWRDLCVKMLGEDTTYKVGGGDVRRLVQIILADIAENIPQNEINPKNLGDYMVSWDLFMDIGGKG
jgi:hypothetical protein